MEHLESGTFYFDTKQAMSSQSDSHFRETRRFNYAHHMAHSWIPKHAYGVGYLPFEWEMAPIIDTIWFNEGFVRYAAIEALAEAMPAEESQKYRRDQLERLRGIVDGAPPFLRRMSLGDLSRAGSFLFADDFRVGRNLFSRGALMAAEMDDFIRAQTQGKKSLRDALRYLLDWSERNHRAFRTEELPGIFREATSVETKSILERWMQPLDR
jgi:predicted metalloprotease with PDZ domain